MGGLGSLEGGFLVGFRGCLTRAGFRVGFGFVGERWVDAWFKVALERFRVG